MPPVIAEANLVACRACLATDTKLYSLATHPLAPSYTLLTGTPFLTSDGLPQHLCSVCSSLLLKFAGFRAKCSTAYIYLQECLSRHHVVATNTIRKIDRTHLELHLGETRTQCIAFIPDNVQNELNLTSTITTDNAAYNFTPDHDYTNNPNGVTVSDSDEIVEKDDEVTKSDGDDEYDTEYLNLDSDSENEYCHVKRQPLSLKYIEIVDEGSDKANNTCDINEIGVTNQTYEDARCRQPLTEDEIVEYGKMFDVEIRILTKEQQMAELIAKKLSSRYECARFKCEICYRGYFHEDALKNHNMQHDASRGFKHKCEICQCYFATKQNLLNHTHLHTMRLKCKRCDLISKTLSEAKQHFDWHNGILVQCEYCPRTFIKLKSKIEHVRIHHGSVPCGICGEAFVGEHGLNMHMRRCHKEALKAICDTCGLLFHSMDALSKHNCDPSLMPCPACGENFDNEGLLDEHLTEKHKLGIHCCMCNNKFRNERLYKLHLFKTHGLRRERSRRKPRSGARSPRASYMCESCGLDKFQSATSLRKHQLVHTGEKPYQCDYCSKTFRTKEQLQIHIFTHTGERPYICSKCPKAFKSATGRHRHRVVHTKERPYICQLCGRTFQQSSYVKIHIRTAHLKEAWPKRIRPSRNKKTKNNQINFLV